MKFANQSAQTMRDQIMGYALLQKISDLMTFNRSRLMYIRPRTDNINVNNGSG